MRPANPQSETAGRRKKRSNKTELANNTLTKTKSARDLNAKVKNCLGIICPICLDPIECGAVSSTICGHIFCTSCIKRAYRSNKSCPTCRHPLKGRTGYHTLYVDHTIPATEREKPKESEKEKGDPPVFQF